MPETPWDVIILGAGPAGALSATLAARAGARTLLLDRASFPRYKVCGCCLAAQGQRVLEQHALTEQVLHHAHRPDHAQIRVAARRAGPAAASIRTMTHATIARDVMDAALVQAATDAGALFRDGAPAAIDPSLGAVLVRNQPLRAKAIVIADGIASTSLRHDPRFAWRTRRRSHVGLGAIIEPDTEAVRIIARFLDPRAITMTAARAGYVGIAALPGGRWAVAAAIDPEAIRTTPGGPRAALHNILRQANLNTDWLEDVHFTGTPALTRRRRAVEAQGQIFLVGDATAYAEPFTGEGMSWALRGASRLHHHLRDALAGSYRPGTWTRDARRLARRGQLACKLVAALLRRPSLAHAAVRTIAAQPRIADRLAAFALTHAHRTHPERAGAERSTS